MGLAENENSDRGGGILRWPPAQQRPDRRGGRKILFVDGRKEQLQEFPRPCFRKKEGGARSPSSAAKKGGPKKKKPAPFALPGETVVATIFRKKTVEGTPHAEG